MIGDEERSSSRAERAVQFDETKRSLRDAMDDTKDIQWDRQTYNGIDKHTMGQTSIQWDRQTYNGTDKHTMGQTSMQWDRQTYRQRNAETSCRSS